MDDQNLDNQLRENYKLALEKQNKIMDEFALKQENNEDFEVDEAKLDKEEREEFKKRLNLNDEDSEAEEVHPNKQQKKEIKAGTHSQNTADDEDADDDADADENDDEEDDDEPCDEADLVPKSQELDPTNNSSPKKKLDHKPEAAIHDDSKKEKLSNKNYYFL